ncbi:hypothetical protein D3C87_1313200 [compost metagenome]
MSSGVLSVQQVEPDALGDNEPHIPMQPAAKALVDQAYLKLKNWIPWILVPLEFLWALLNYPFDVPVITPVWNWVAGIFQSVRNIFNWWFIYPIKHEKWLIERARAELSKAPRDLLAWEDQRNKTNMRLKMGKRLVFLLFTETIVIFALVFIHGIKWNGFQFENEQYFTVFINATLIQVAAMVIFVVRSLFPPGNNKDADSLRADGSEPKTCSCGNPIRP